MQLLGQLELGIYTNRSHNGLNAGSLQEVVINQQSHVRHEGVEVPDHHNPFNDKQAEEFFFDTSNRLSQRKSYQLVIIYIQMNWRMEYTHQQSIFGLGNELGRRF
jgi:hypothetical protein